ncbi:glycoside hydrolase family 127 protein [Bacteroidales bacterium OttesenSCG-928-L03]|nr:glycoside hydrolase family 127 protein [Bacteroidales bacterium OttesenSCG-928-L03]
MKRSLSLLLALVCLSSVSFAQLRKQVTAFPLGDIKLLDSPFKQAQENNLKYVLAMDPDRLLAPFQREAGLPQKAESYTNWENTGLDGHIGGHYLSALSLLAASTGDKEIQSRLDYMINELKRCQEANGNGYIGGVPGGKIIWEEVAQGTIRAGGFDLNKKWVPLYNIHKTYAGLRDAWLYTGNETAKEMLIRMTDWAIRLVSQLSEEQIQDMLRSEHGGLNETFADVAAITGNEKYLHLARQFSHRTILDPLLRREDRLTGMHANTQIPKVIGYKRIADLEGNEDWSEASKFFWETVVENRSVCIGGNSAFEQFHSAHDFSKMITGDQGPETCNTYNMLRLSKMLYETSMDKRFIDYYERALYNHILSTQHPENGGLVYFTQMRPGHYRVYSQPHTCMWCCVGSGIENHSKYGEMIYAHIDDNELLVNLFIPSQLHWKEKQLELIQENHFPDEARTSLIINPKKKTRFTLSLRHPDWVKDGELTVFLNGKEQKTEKDSRGYVSLTRKWKKGDRIEVQMPMHIHAEQLPDQSNYFAFLYGPVVLAAQLGAEDMPGLFANDSRMAHVAQGRKVPMKDIPVLVGPKESITDHVKPVPGKPLTFSLSGLFPDDKWKDLQLTPFFRLHESRYAIYWPQATQEEVVAWQQELEKQEANKIKLDAITLDKVLCGQQQPESDHFISFDKSATGYTEGNHWREAQGHFSYILRNKTRDAAFLYLVFLDQDRRSYNIFLNNHKLAAVSLDGGKGDKPHEVLYSIPENLRKEDALTLRFEAEDRSRTAKIVEVRLLNKTYNIQ